MTEHFPEDLIELRDGSFASSDEVKNVMTVVERITDEATQPGGISERLALEALLLASKIHTFGPESLPPHTYREDHERALQHRLIDREPIVLTRLDPDMHGPADPRRLIARRVIASMVVVDSADSEEFELQNPLADHRDPAPTE